MLILVGGKNLAEALYLSGEFKSPRIETNSHARISRVHGFNVRPVDARMQAAKRVEPFLKVVALPAFLECRHNSTLLQPHVDECRAE